MSKFLDPKQLQEAAWSVNSQLHDEQINAALAGGYAMQLYGSDRLTGDLDFVASSLPTLPPSKFPHLRRLSFGGLSIFAPNGVPTDIIVRNDDYAALYEAALDTAGVTEGSDSLKVVRPEYLAAMKLQADRGKDQQDLAFLIAEEKIDLEETRRVIKIFMGTYAREDFDSVVSEVLWKKSRGEL